MLSNDKIPLTLYTLSNQNWFPDGIDFALNLIQPKKSPVNTGLFISR